MLKPMTNLYQFLGGGDSDDDVAQDIIRFLYITNRQLYMLSDAEER